MKYIINLDYLRAFLAWSVVISHLLDRLNIVHLQIGNYAVSGFFVLSGFIISLLLFKEIENYGRIELISFYIRRILRIWPLYFFYILLCLIYVRFEGLSKFYYYILMMPNIAYIKEEMISFTNHYWSLGVEEQFYIFWPILLFFFRKSFLIFISLIIVCFLILKIIFQNTLVFDFLHCSRFDLMALGGGIAFIYYKGILDSFFNKYKIIKLKIIYLVVFIYIATVLFNFFYIHKILNHLIFGGMVALLIIALIFDTCLFPRNKFIEINGKISFGVYVYHSLILEIVINRFFINFYKDNVYVIFIVLFCSLFLIYFISYISFFYFEKKFNDLRENYKKV